MLQISTLLALITMAFAVPSASASSENDVSDCEFVVDDFAVVTSGVYGTSSSELVAQLLVRPDLDQRVVEAGAYFEFSGNYRKLISGPDGSPTPEDWKVDNEQTLHCGSAHYQTGSASRSPSLSAGISTDMTSVREH